jgi:hypothetical protein
MNERTALNDYLRAELEQFCAEFVRDRAAALRQRGASASGDLARSLEYEVRAQAMDAGVQAMVAFEEHGRFIDMRRLQPAEGGADYIQNIIQWIKDKGLEEKMIEGYTSKRNLTKLPDRVLTFIAFGIARKRFNGKYKRTRWYNKSKTAKISALYDEVLAGMPDVVLEELKNGFAPRTSGGTRLTTTASPGSRAPRRYDYREVKSRSREEGYTL